jgi:hypothetical protein
MLYFNAFFSRGWQSCFILLAWALAAVFFALDVAGIIQVTRVMHLCFLLVSVSAPLLVFGIEMKMRTGVPGSFFTKERTVIFGDDGIDYIVDGKKKGAGHDSWDAVVIHETKYLFIISQDRYGIPVPKTAFSKTDVDILHQELGNRIGKRYVDHMFCLM